MSHAKAGITTEIAELYDIVKKHFWYGKELDHVHIQEEIGDTMWYIAIILRAYENINLIGGSTPEDFGLSENSSIIVFTELLSDLADKIKKDISAVEGTSSDIIEDTQEFLEFLWVYCHRFGYDLNKIMETNIAKLKARYPEKFESNQAINRNLDNERNVLDQGLK